MSEGTLKRPCSAVLLRHGETAWSLSGRHTGLTDIPLLPEGEDQARRLSRTVSPLRLSAVWVSPLARAVRTCELSGLGGVARKDPDLVEWDYGDYEGLVRSEIDRMNPSWNIFRDGCPGGESPAQVVERAQRVIARVRSGSGDAALFSHGHFGRALAALWAGLRLEDAGRLVLGTAGVGILGYDRGSALHPGLALWNAPAGTEIALPA
jgi:probable phosphoglycerate mutase